MSAEFFLKLEGLKGESQDHAHEEAIEVVDWSWSASNPGSMHEARGGGTGKADFGDLSITKYVDTATPVLWQHLATGKHIPTGELIARKAGGDPVEFLRIELETILVSGIQVGGAEGETRTTEQITLNFAQWKLFYTPQEPDGTAGAEVDFGFNIPKHEAV